MAVDDAVGLLDGPGFVSAGGDLAARETPVSVALADGAAVTLVRGGIATSGTATRRWLRGGELQHHLIDPRTGAPSRSPWLYVTAIGRTCTAADVAAKAGFLLGHDGPEWLDENRRRRALRHGRRRVRRERPLDAQPRTGAGMGLTSDPTAWYVMRASGIVAYLLLTVVAVVGLAMSGRVRLPWPRFAVEDVHRFGGLLIGVFVGIHVLTVAIHTYIPFSIGELVVPFMSDYRPLWTALGIVAAELLLALAVTNRLRRSMPHRIWRNLHRLNLVVWVAATAHGLGSGSDRGSAWLLTLYFLAIAAVVERRRDPAHRRHDHRRTARPRTSRAEPARRSGLDDDRRAVVDMRRDPGDRTVCEPDAAVRRGDAERCSRGRELRAARSVPGRRRTA